MPVWGPTWYFVAIVLMVPVSSMHRASTTTEARMAASVAADPRTKLCCRVFVLNTAPNTGSRDGGLEGGHSRCNRHNSKLVCVSAGFLSPRVDFGRCLLSGMGVQGAPRGGSSSLISMCQLSHFKLSHS